MKLILAADPVGGIGYQNKLPWDKLSGDLQRFKQLTDGQTIIMGRNTWDSLPFRPLPNRQNIVVTSNPLSSTFNSTKTVSFAYLTQNLEDYKNAWLIGGAKIVEALWGHISEIHLSRTFDEYTCDVFVDMLRLETEFYMDAEEVEIFTDYEYQIWKRK